MIALRLSPFRADMAGDDDDVGLPVRLAHHRREPGEIADLHQPRIVAEGDQREGRAVGHPLDADPGLRRIGAADDQAGAGQVLIGQRPAALAEIAAVIVGVGDEREAGAAQIVGVEGRAAEGEAEARIAAGLGIVAAGVDRAFEIAEDDVAGAEQLADLRARAPRRDRRPA